MLADKTEKITLPNFYFDSVLHNKNNKMYFTKNREEQNKEAALKIGTDTKVIREGLYKLRLHLQAWINAMQGAELMNGGMDASCIIYEKSTALVKY